MGYAAADLSLSTFFLQCCAVLEQWHVQIHDIPTPPGRHGGVGALIGSPMAACNIGQVQYMYLSREVIQRFVAVSCLRNQLRRWSSESGAP